VENITGFIIAGGKSSRMGTEKAFLKVQGKTLIDHAIAQARVISEDILIAGPKETFSAYGRIVVDVYPGCGPLSGIHAALGRSSTHLNLMLAVDTPFISREFLRYLALEAESSKALVTLPRTKDGLQPLCAIYHKDFLPIAESALKERKYKLDALFPRSAQTHIIDVESEPLRKMGFNPAMFDNLNTQEDYERAKSLKFQSANHNE
jgi:molybdenum cofactor guanylyltransferase